MPRPRKCRMVCRLPGASEFVPLDGRKDASPIVLTVDEFEALRLIDGEDYSQEQCHSKFWAGNTACARVARRAAAVAARGAGAACEIGRKDLR